MGPEPEQHCWTFYTLEKYLSDKIASVKETAALALEASNKAVDRAADMIDKRLDTMNEFRKALEDQTQSIVPRTEHATKWAADKEKMDSLELRLTTLSTTLNEKSASFSRTITIILGATALIVPFAT